MARTSTPAATTLTVRPEWAKARRIVVKIGSALLTDRTTGHIKSEWLNSLMDDVAEVQTRGACPRCPAHHGSSAPNDRAT